MCVRFDAEDPAEDAEDVDREGESGGRLRDEVGEVDGEGDMEDVEEDEDGGARDAAAPRRATLICSGGTCHVAR